MRKMLILSGVFFASIGMVLFASFGFYLTNFAPTSIGDLQLNGIAYYLAATGGCIALGLAYAQGRVLQSLGEPGEAAVSGAGLAFLLLGIMRLWAYLADNAELKTIHFLLPFETVLFLGLGLWFLQVGYGFFGRLSEAFRSLRAAPLWVQAWVWLFLAPINLASVVFFVETRHLFPAAAAIGFGFVLVSNLALVTHERGISKLTSLPHLIPWVPLQAFSGWLLLFQPASLKAHEFLYEYTLAYFIVIGISNLFDAYDTFRWFRGERTVLGGFGDLELGGTP